MYKKIALICSFIFFFAQNFFPQPEYLIKISNTHLVDDYTIQFDVLASAPETLEITSYQCAFSLYPGINSTGQYSFSYVDGSTQLKNKPTLGISAKLLNDKVELTFASLVGNDTLDKKISRIGSFKVKRSSKIDINNIFLNWNFSGDNVTILTGHLFTNITDSTYFYSDKALTDVKDKEALPSDFTLEQNYPNPFNPSTKIRFYLKDAGKVKLDIYNIIGERVSKLINEELPAGFHEINFKADHLASGVYIYKLDVENKFLSVKKMILQK